MVGKTKLSKKTITRLAVFGGLIVLLIALSAFLIHFILRYNTAKRNNAEASEAIASMSDEMEELAKEKSDLESRLNDQQSKIEQQESELQEKDKTIRKQESSVSSLKKQLAVKKKNAAKSTTLKQTSPSVAKTGKMIALTFDDGPGPYTNQLLDELKKRHAHATFFVVGKRVNSYKSVIRRMEDEGHLVGNHSQSHKNLKYLSVSAMQKEIRSCSDKIKAIIGHDPLVMRCPGGNCNANVKAYAKEQNMPIFYWSVDTRDWESHNVDKILKTAFQSGKYGIRDGAIVLMHDIYKTSVEAAVIMMDRLIEQGYELVTVTELINAKQGTIKPGTVYYSC